MSRGLRRAAHLAMVAVLMALAVVFARHVDWRATAASVRGADPLLLVLALVANLVSLALKGVRWWVFLRGVGVRSLSLVLRATFAGASLNNVVVAQGGDAARVIAVSRGASVPASHVFGALALERLLDGVCYLLLLIGAAWVLPLPAVISRFRPAAALLLAVVIITLGIVSLRTPRRSIDEAPGVIGRFVNRLRAAASLVATPRRITAGLLLSVGAWTLQIACYHLTARAAHLTIPFTASVAALLTVGVGFLVRATPGNVGVFQVIYALAMRSFGVAEGPAVAAAILIQTIQVLPVMLLGALAAPSLVTRSDQA